MVIKKYGTKELEKDSGKLTFGRSLEANRKCVDISQKILQ